MKVFVNTIVLAAAIVTLTTCAFAIVAGTLSGRGETVTLGALSGILGALLLATIWDELKGEPR